MSFLNYIPGVAHVKAGVHLICNDKEGAAKTIETCNTKAPILSHINAGVAKLAGYDKFAQKCWEGGNSSLNALPVVGHVKGLGHYICGDIKGGNQAMVDATITTSSIADGIPVVGHVKGIVHYACGDTDGGNKAMLASTRTTAVMGAGAAGFVVAGPVGAVAGGVTAGGGWDVTTALVTDGREANGIAKIIQNPTSVDSYFDAGLSIVGDGFVGHSGGKIAERAIGYNSNPGDSTAPSAAKGEVEGAASVANEEALNAASEQMGNDFLEGRISYSELEQKYAAIKPNDVPSIKVNSEQLKIYSEKGFITDQQYNQARGEMAKTGSKQTTVFIAPSKDRLNSSNGNNDDHKKLKQIGIVVGGEAIIAAAAKQLIADLDAGIISFNEYQQKWDAISACSNGSTSGGSTTVTVGESEVSAAKQLVNDYHEGKISYNEYQQKWGAMKPKNVPVKVTPEQLNLYSEKELITERQYKQAMGEMTKTGSKQATVVMAPSSREGLSTKSSNNQKEQKQKENSKANQPPQQPTNTKKTSADETLILLLRQRLFKLIERIRQRREQDPMQRDRQFQIESFQEVFNIVSELISNGQTLSINTSDFNTLEISSRDGSWREEIEYQIADYLNVHGQLFNQRFPINPGSSCPTVLSAQFQSSQLLLTLQTNHNTGPAIYGIRCRLCDRRAGPCNINYVGLTKRSAHARVCGEHARASRDLINEGANAGEESSRPMYEHVAEHFQNGDLPEGTQARDAFRQVMDAILLPISGGPEELRSWEAFWQFFFHCREFFWGWSQR